MPTVQEFSKAPADFADHFPAQFSDPEPGVFELGLVMGGTVSAGAYTAGVVDFLIEALDTWEAQKPQHANDPAMPDWKIRLQALSGTSGGGVIAALLGRALSFKFPPIRKDSPAVDWQKNPLYRVWVEELDIRKMLPTGDIDKRHSPLCSLLNPAPLDTCKSLIANYESSFAPVARMNRSYLPEPLPIYLTLTNLRGIPYRVDMGAGMGQNYVDHADYVRIAAFTKGGNAPLRPDESGVSDHPDTTGFLSWTSYADFALGTSAFPIGFPQRSLSHPITQLRYRPVVVQDMHGQTSIKPQLPDWSRIVLADGVNLPETYAFSAADGGMIDNEPLELCRRAIAGWVGRNPRKGSEARRAVLLIDPFAEAPALGAIPNPAKPAQLSCIIGTLFSTWKNQARYDSRDIMLATDPDCFSRFMITARRMDNTSEGKQIEVEPGGKSIATASVGAFGGFLAKEFRRHDFLLGRANCQKYLRETLVLPLDNPLFAAWKSRASATDLARWIVLDGEAPSLPIIPLLGACAITEKLEVYPKYAFHVYSDRAFQAQLKERIDAVTDRLRESITPDGLLGVLSLPFLSIAESISEHKLKDAISKAIFESLIEWKLADKPQPSEDYTKVDEDDLSHV